MINELSSIIVALAEKPKQVIPWILCILFTLACAWFAYDWYTQNTNLNRIERVLGIIERVGELDRNQTFTNSDIEFSRKWMIEKLKSYTTSPSTSPDIETSTKSNVLKTTVSNYFYRISLAGLPWFALSFIALFESIKKKSGVKDYISTLFGFYIVSLFFGVITCLFLNSVTTIGTLLLASVISFV
ncbi:MAG: hypothetical protein ACF8OB_17910, partial [Phycisphaeraceae bacterium JB051]